MKIVDAQLHTWRCVKAGALPHRSSSLEHVELAEWMRAAGVDAAVLVPPTWACDGNEVALTGARADPNRFAVMGKPRFGTPPNASLRDWRQAPGMLGLRLVLYTRAQRQAFENGSLSWIWRDAEAFDIPVMVYPPGLIAEIARVAAEHPGLRLIVDHCGAPVEGGISALTTAVHDLHLLRDSPNVAIKVSSLPHYSEKPYPFADVQEVLRDVLASFGPHRMLWGSDLTRLRCTYREAVAMMTDDFGGLSDAVLTEVMGGALCKWIRWDRPLAQ